MVVDTFTEPVATCGEWRKGWTTLISNHGQKSYELPPPSTMGLLMILFHNPPKLSPIA